MSEVSEEKKTGIHFNTRLNLTMFAYHDGV